MIYLRILKKNKTINLQRIIKIIYVSKVKKKYWVASFIPFGKIYYLLQKNSTCSTNVLHTPFLVVTIIYGATTQHYFHLSWTWGLTLLKHL